MLRQRKTSRAVPVDTLPAIGQIYRRKREAALGVLAAVQVFEVDVDVHLVGLQGIDSETLQPGKGSRRSSCTWKTLHDRYTRAPGLEQQRDQGKQLAGEIDRRGGGEVKPEPLAVPDHVQAALSEQRQLRAIVAKLIESNKQMAEEIHALTLEIRADRYATVTPHQETVS